MMVTCVKMMPMDVGRLSVLTILNVQTTLLQLSGEHVPLVHLVLQEMAQYVPVCFGYKRDTNYFCCCKDVDECADITLASTCSQNCVNTYGSFECQCNSGFELDADGHTCNGKKFNKF